MEVSEIVSRAGGPMRVSRLIGRHHATIVRWRRVPAEHAIRVSEAAKLPLHVIRPDVFPCPVALPHEDGTVTDSRAIHARVKVVGGAP